MSPLIPFILEGIRCTYWWYGIKRDVAEYVALCNTCQKLKVEHQMTHWIVATLACTRAEVGRKLLRILLLDCLGLSLDMIPFGYLWTD
jgi:hypothetical protein